MMSEPQTLFDVTVEVASGGYTKDDAVEMGWSAGYDAGVAAERKRWMTELTKLRKAIHHGAAGTVALPITGVLVDWSSALAAWDELTLALTNAGGTPDE